MSTITTIAGSDQPKNSRAVINTNFSNLNSDKVEGTSGTLTTPTINGAIAGTCYPPMTFYSANFNAPEGFLINGKIVPSVASNNLTVAIKGMDGNDPSASNPVYVRVGDTIRSITAALSCTKNAGTNWSNLGSAETATKECDLFVYLMYNSVDAALQIGWSRIPFATTLADFGTWSSTQEKIIQSNASSVPASTDPVSLIGRFAATLSAGAGYTWSVPTFTPGNLIQRPIYETRVLSWTPTFTGFNSTIPTGYVNGYQLKGSSCVIFYQTGTPGTSNAVSYTQTLPFIALYTLVGIARTLDAGTYGSGLAYTVASANTITFSKTVAADAGFTASGNKDCQYLITYLI